MQQPKTQPSKSCAQARKPWKKQVKLLSLLTIILLGVFTLANSPFFSAASATYVWGSITQDTVWTPTDSPFVIANDVTVYPNATLTIEPGVEVRFGGAFSLVINGTLLASGTKDKMITFTSNREQPEAGDWEAIEFRGTGPSKLSYCFVEYGTDGVTIEDGRVDVVNSEIANNSRSGIHLSGDNQATIRYNTIRSNAIGILLTGTSTSGANIRYNTILSNTDSGIKLAADDYTNIVILYNVLSANTNGFHISGQADTYITNNSISFNTVGVFYAQAEGHEIHFNDIYENELGMQVSSAYNVTVNAEYNYWGDESGPYHISLNPAGKGNPVGGDGVNLDFIFFLTKNWSYINERPTARLLTDITLVPPNQAVTFIATNSSDDKRVDQYLFDFGDGRNSGWTTLSIFVHKYSAVGTYDASITVMDDYGVNSTNTAMATIDVQVLTPLDVSVTPAPYTVGSEDQASITVHVTDGATAVENATITLFSVGGGSFTTSSGTTNSTGYFITTFTAPNVTQIANVRITATASMSGYADGSDYKYLEVVPPLLVQVTADPDAIKSEATLNVRVQVTYSGQPVPDALLTVSSDGGGDFSPQIGTTDLGGNVTFVFTAPQTTTQLNSTITATATKTGYVGGEGRTKITVNPRMLVVQFDVFPSAINSQGSSQITVHVTSDGAPVTNVTVTLAAGGGTFSPVNGTTDSDGDAAFTFTAPQATTELNVTMTATASKIGYVDGQDQVVITVTPRTIIDPGEGAGLPLTTILLIALPVIGVVVVLLLIKLKVIGITWKEE